MDDLLRAATVEFAAHGFDGASTRSIALRAGAHQPQINYHFTSKEHLWRATVTRLFGLLADRGVPATDRGDTTTAFRASVGHFLEFSADHPELNRIINLEAVAPSTRLRWLVDTHLSPLYRQVRATWLDIRDSGAGADLAPEEVWELVTGYGALHFATAPMLSMLGVAPAGTDAATQTGRVLRILFPDMPSTSSPASP